MKSKFKFVLIIVGTLAILYGLSGCSINKDFVSICQKSWGIIAPEYLEYVKADDKLSDEAKIIRMRTAKNFTLMLEEAAK